MLLVGHVLVLGDVMWLCLPRPLTYAHRAHPRTGHGEQAVVSLAPSIHYFFLGPFLSLSGQPQGHLDE